MNQSRLQLLISDGGCLDGSALWDKLLSLGGVCRTGNCRSLHVIGDDRLRGILGLKVFVGDEESSRSQRWRSSSSAAGPHLGRIPASEKCRPFEWLPALHLLLFHLVVSRCPSTASFKRV